jgi:hypothetical protein
VALALTITHRLPGRLRLRLSRPLNDPSMLTRHVSQHDGMLGISYTPVSGSVLVLSDPGRVAQEEIVLRVALALSLDHGAEPVRVYSDPSAPHLGPPAVLSGVALLVAVVAHLGRRAHTGADLAAGAATLWAAADHGWGEIRQRGTFDPEVASLFLLVAAMVRGNTLPAALLTWFSTFGRHLVEAPRTAVEVRPMQLSGGPDGPRYEVAVAPVQAEARGVPLLRAVPSLLMYAFTGARGGLATGLINDMREVSRLHHSVLEGLGTTTGGFPLHVR